MTEKQKTTQLILNESINTNDIILKLKQKDSISEVALEHIYKEVIPRLNGVRKDAYEKRETKIKVELLYAAVMQHSLATEDMKKTCLKKGGEYTYRDLSANSDLSTELLDYIAKNAKGFIALQNVIRHKNTSEDTLKKLAVHPSNHIREYLAISPTASADVLDTIIYKNPSFLSKYLYKEKPEDNPCHPKVCAVANNNVSRKTLLSDEVLGSENKEVRREAVVELIEQSYSKKEVIAMFPVESYEKQMSLANHKDPIVRAYLSMQKETYTSVIKHILKNATEPVVATQALENYKNTLDFRNMISRRNVVEALSQTSGGKSVLKSTQFFVHGHSMSLRESEHAYKLIARDPGTDASELKRILEMDMDDVITEMAKNEAAPPSILKRILDRSDARFNFEGYVDVSERKNMSEDVFDRIVSKVAEVSQTKKESNLWTRADDFVFQIVDDQIAKNEIHRAIKLKEAVDISEGGFSGPSEKLEKHIAEQNQIPSVINQDENLEESIKTKQ